ncbi:uncharacterized protein [Anas platyrhynchos]|uniref:uncharacterized protein n=1 Tax=Anas platyrhynchos TaxID=8839 RepID=UPI003AF2F069
MDASRMLQKPDSDQRKHTAPYRIKITTKAGKEWAQKFWKDEEKVVERIEQCQASRRIGLRKDPESWDGDIWSDDDDGVEEVSDPEPQSISLRPLVKTETTVDDNDEIRTTVRTIPWSPAELIKIQEKFSRRPGESEVEYVWRVSLEGGDRIMLSEEEAANTQDRIQAAHRDGDRGRRRNPNFPIPTWSEFVQDLDKYGRRMGWINSSSIKPQDHSRRVRQIHTKNPRYPNFKNRFKFNKERDELWLRAVKQTEQLRRKQNVIVRGPFRILDVVRKGTIPPAGIAQKPTVRKWYAYLEGINEIMPITEGNTKISKLQKDIDSALLFQLPPTKPSPIQEAPPLKEDSDLTGVWFTDASSHRENNKWKYKAVALEVATGEKLIETGEGSAQVDSLTRLRQVDLTNDNQEWERLLEWLHVKRGHTGRADLYREETSSTTKDKKPLPPQIFENEPTQPPISLTPSIFKTGPYIIKNVGQQQILFNPSWSLKRVELALHINISEINSKCTTFLRTAYTGWLAWLHGRSLKQSQRVPRDATGLLGTGLGILNSIDAEVLMSRVTATTDDLRKLEQPIKSSLLALGANQWLLSDILPHWEQIEENDHQLIVNALGKAQGNTSLALSCIQAQLWIQSVAAAIIREGEGGTLPTEIRKLIWDNASEFEKEFQAWWQLVNFTHYSENDKIVAFILTISNATVYNVYPIIALGLNHNGTILYPKEHKVWAHQKGGKWQTIDVNACIVREQKGFICESNTLESQDICLDTEQNICHFEIHPNETLETVLIYIGKGCVCMRTHCDSIVVDDTVVDTSNHSNVCVCNFTKILGCDFKYSAPVTSYQLIASNYILLHELLPTPIGMNLTLVKKLLVHEDLKQLMTQVRENGQKTLITVHHDAQEIHRVMERVQRDERHRWWDTLFGWSPAAKGIFNKMLHPVIVLLILTVFVLY